MFYGQHTNGIAKSPRVAPRPLEPPGPLHARNDDAIGPFDMRCERDPSEPPVSVLLVEDDPLIREFVVEALRDAGYHVIHASTGEEALDWCKRHVADVLVTDVTLPGNIDGWQIAERCRESDPELPVIYATGYSPAAPRPVPGSRILNKPYHPDEVVRMVGDLGGEKGMPPN